MTTKVPLNLAHFLELSPQEPFLLGISCSKSFVHGHTLGHYGFRKTTLKWPKPRVLMTTASAYTRTPMETAGAYQLIDNETGEKFILWGGVDDDSPIPSREILSWKPVNGAHERPTMKKKKQHQQHQQDMNEGGVKPVSKVDEELSQGFGRLKAPKVRSLIRKFSQLKQESVADDYEGSGLEDTSFNISDSLEAEHELMMKKNSKGVNRHSGKLSITTESQEVKSLRRGGATIPWSKRSDIVHENDFEQLPKSQIKSAKHHDHDHGVIQPEGSVTAAASLRAWNSIEPLQSSRFDSVDNLQQRKKFRANSGFFSSKSFSDLGYKDFMIESLRAQLFHCPSHIQALASKPVLDGRSCIIAEQSGSGKTLAYLAPVIQHLRQEELQGLSKSSSSSPRLIVLVPTAELASQVLNTCRSLSKFGVPFRSMVATGGFRQKTQLENLQQELDVLIATPGRFMYLLKEGFLHLKNLKCAVLDEVDILIGDEDFEQVLQHLINSAPVTTQYLFVTATLPVDIYNKLVEVFPDCEVIMGPGIHRTSSGLEEILVDCSGDDGTEKNPESAFFNKKSALLQIAEENPVSKTIIFCNKIETCRKVENALKRFDRKELHIRVLPFHAALAQEARLVNMKEFLNSQSKEENLFLICTDRASRGIDFVGVDHVVLFDFPRDPSEYVRRVGRTARGAGGKGKAFVFVVGKQVSLARRIMARNKKGHPLHDVPPVHELFG